jgi:arginine decarboxylase
LIPETFRPSAIAQPLRSGLRNMMAAWSQDEFVLDPSRITLSIGRTGYDGDTFKRQQLMDRYGIQINKTSRNSVLFMTNIGTTRSSVAFLVEVLVNIARELDEDISEMSLGEREHFERAVYRLTKMSLSLPDFGGFHPAFLDHGGSEPTPEGDVRRAFYLSYDDTNCEYLTSEQVYERLDAGSDVVSATFVTPYPPGFPVLVPGQVFSRQVLDFMRDLDTPEIHGYLPNFGYRVYTEKAIEMAGASAGLTSNGHRSAVRTPTPAPQKPPKKKPAKRSGNDGDRKVPEVGHDELIGQQQPGDALAAAPSADQGVAEVGAEELTGEQHPGDAVKADKSA